TQFLRPPTIKQSLRAILSDWESRVREE
ncbi:hypothetical protein, partial [Pseudomonas aeruginosa]